MATPAKMIAPGTAQPIAFQPSERRNESNEVRPVSTFAVNRDIITLAYARHNR